MKIYLESIARIADSSYRAKLSTSLGGHRTFDFVVSGEDIRGVEASAEFEAFMRSTGWSARNLFASVLAMDMVQGNEVDDE